ncbi:MAG TPA: hypothetical protein VJ824_07365 [Bacillota bacterium]|nr:hypothetical protein [Bacillota bacterium]
MQHQLRQPKMGISSIVLDLTKWDYRVGHSGLDSLDITITKNDEELVDVSFSPEEMKIFRKREFSELEENEFQLFLDDLLWEDEFTQFAHLAHIEVEYQSAEELVRMIQEKYQDDMLFVRFNDVREFMGYLESVSVEKIDGNQTLLCYFSPVDDAAEMIRADIMLRSQIKAIATASSLKVEGISETLEMAIHVEHTH